MDHGQRGAKTLHDGLLWIAHVSRCGTEQGAVAHRGFPARSQFEVAALHRYRIGGGGSIQPGRLPGSVEVIGKAFPGVCSGTPGACATTYRSRSVTRSVTASSAR